MPYGYAPYHPAYAARSRYYRPRYPLTRFSGIGVDDPAAAAAANAAAEMLAKKETEAPGVWDTATQFFDSETIPGIKNGYLAFGALAALGTGLILTAMK